MQVFQIAPSDKCPHVWSFIQRHIYELKACKIYTKVSDFIKELTRISSEENENLDENMNMECS